MVISKRSLLILALLLFPVSYIFRTLAIFAYYDEMVGVFSVIYVLLELFKNRFNKKDTYICYLLLLITAIGIISNVFSCLITNIFAISVDILWLWKTFACYIAFKYIIIQNQYRNSMIKTLSFFSKFAILITFVTAIIGQFLNIGVTSDYTAYGFKEFIFWGNALQTGWLLICSLLILAAYDSESSNFFKYYTMAIISALFTLSSLVYCFFFLSSVLILCWKKDKVLKIRHIFVLGTGVCLFTITDIKNYFFSESIRMKLIKGGINAANRYFPLGSGFATYGSEMASRYYSKLYVEYGWENSWGLGRMYSQYLNDNFFAGIIGQFGWVGFICYLGVMLLLFMEVNSMMLNRRERSLAIATVLTLAVVMIGSASAKSAMGVCTFAVLGIICSKNNSKEND